MKLILRISAICCTLLLSIICANAGSETSPMQSLEGKQLVVFPYLIAPDINPACICITHYFYPSILDFGEDGSFSVTGNYISDCQEGYYFQLDTPTIYANVEECAGPNGVQIMSFNSTLEPTYSASFVFVSGRYAVEFFSNNMNCVEEGLFVGWGM